VEPFCQPPFECQEPFACQAPDECQQAFECGAEFQACPQGHGCMPVDPFDCLPPFECQPPFECELAFECELGFECMMEFQCGGPAFGCVEPFDWCATPPPFTCPANFTCNANTAPPFSGCHYPDFSCEWIEAFQCEVAQAVFDCDKVEEGSTGFSCPPWEGTPPQGWFDCPTYGTPPPFDCAYPTAFDCGGQAATFLCGVTGRFQPTCGPGGQPEWHCTNVESWFDYVCGGDNETYNCNAHQCSPGMAIFRCGDYPDYMRGKFHCNPGPAGEVFDCTPGAGKQYDFDCENHEFTCGPSAEHIFECDGRHEFTCWGGGIPENEGFACGSGFVCKAGGSRCGVGATGQYHPWLDDDSTPGDFYCGGQAIGADFRCSANFQCSGMADDFRCFGEDGYLAFQCAALFGGCNPSGSSARFRCDQTGNEFECPGVFTCPGGRYMNA